MVIDLHIQFVLFATLIMLHIFFLGDNCKS